jgi:acylphosphatase
MRRVRVLIIGDVQNVGFRAWVKHKAELLHVRGWVRNNIDGTVEAIFEGTEPQVQEMVEACSRGPPASYVEKVEVSEESMKGIFPDFRIIK